MQPVSKQWIGKHIPAATNLHTTIQLLLETVYATWSVQSGYKEDIWDDQVISWKPVKGNYEVGVKWPLAWELVVSWDRNSKQEAVKIEPESMKPKNLHC
jgi:hypothetical protein